MALFCVVIITVISLNCLTTNTKAEYVSNVSIDRQLDNGYSKIEERTNYTVYFANSNDKFFLLVNFTYNISNANILINSGILTIDLNNYNISTEYFQSQYYNFTLEFMIYRNLITENKLIIIVDSLEISLILIPVESPISPGPIPSTEEEEEKKEEKKKGELVLSDWGWITIVIFMFCAFAMYDTMRRVGNKIIIKAYKQENKEENPIDHERTMTGLTTIGEYKPKYSGFDKDLRCFVFWIRHRMKYFKIKSNQPMEEYMNVHYIERNYLIRYSLNANVFVKDLTKNDWYEDDLGWSIQSYVYRGFSFVYNLSPSGLVFGSLITGFIFIFSFPTLGYAFLLGVAVGLCISAINFVLRKYTKVCDKLIKRKKQLIKTETYMSPLEAQEYVLDVYRVWGTKQTEIITSDGAKELKRVKLLDYDTEGNIATYKNKLNITKTATFMTVVGYDSLYRLQLDPLVQIRRFKVVDTAIIKRSNAEMLSSKRDYISRNREFVEDNFRLKKTNNELQDYIRSLEIQLQTVLETSVKKLKEFGENMIKQKEWQENTIMNVFKTIAGQQFIDNDYKKWMKEIMKELEQERNLSLIGQLQVLIKAVRDLLYMVGDRTGLNKKDIENLVDKLAIAGEKQIATT